MGARRTPQLLSHLVPHVRKCEDLQLAGLRHSPHVLELEHGSVDLLPGVLDVGGQGGAESWVVGLELADHDLGRLSSEDALRQAAVPDVVDPHLPDGLHGVDEGL